MLSVRMLTKLIPLKRKSNEWYKRFGIDHHHYNTMYSQNKYTNGEIYSMSKKRKWLPTLGELIDRLSIHQLKEVFIPENKKNYAKRN